MTAGIQLFNDSGSVLFDQDYVNVALKTKGTVTIPSIGYVSIKFYSCTVPILGINFSGIANTYQWFDADGTTLNVVIAAAVGAVVSYYMFDTPGAPANYGLVIYRADGIVAFDATKQYARVADVWAGTDFITGLGTRTYLAGRTYAVVFGKVGHWHNGYNVVTGTLHAWHDDYEDTQVSMDVNRVTVGSVKTSTIDRDGSQALAYVQESKSWSLMILDVTGF